MGANNTPDRLVSAQAAVLGCLLLDSSLCGEIFARVSADDFATAEYRHVFEAAHKLFVAGRHVDAVTVCAALGGTEYRELLMQVVDITPSTVAWEEYTAVLREQSRLWRLRKVAERMLLAADMEQARALLGEAQTLTTEQTRVRIVNVAQGMVNFLTEQETPRSYIPYGISRLDRMLYTDKGDMVVIGGRPSAGKTLLAITMAHTMAKDYRVGFFSLETSDRKIFDRYFAQACDIKFSRIKRRALTPQDLADIADAKANLLARKLDVIDAAGMTVDDIRAIALARQYEVIFVDYLQLVRGSARPHATRAEEVASVSRALHTLATANHIAVIALAQLTRPERQGEAQKAPTLDSLRESGQIEQDADAVMLLYLEDPTKPGGDRRLKVAKNKEGPLTAITLCFDGERQQLTEYLDDCEAAARGAPVAPKGAKYQQQEIRGA